MVLSLDFLCNCVLSDCACASPVGCSVVSTSYMHVLVQYETLVDRYTASRIISKIMKILILKAFISSSAVYSNCQETSQFSSCFLLEYLEYLEYCAREVTLVSTALWGGAYESDLNLPLKFDLAQNWDLIWSKNRPGKRTKSAKNKFKLRRPSDVTSRCAWWVETPGSYVKIYGWKISRLYEEIVWLPPNGLRGNFRSNVNSAIFRSE